MLSRAKPAAIHAAANSAAVALPRRRPSSADLVLLAAAVLMFGVLLYVGRWLLFWRDEWDWMLNRPDPTPRALLAPFADTFVAVPVLVYDGLLAVFGMRTYLPYLLVAWAAHFTAVALLYRIVARRSGSILGLSAAISLLFLGSGFEVLLHPFQIQYLFAIVGGLLALDQLDTLTPRTGRRNVMTAAVALVLGVASSGLGVIFTGLILVWGVLRRNRPTLVAIVPAVAVYAAWYFTWGRESANLSGPGLGPLESVYAVLYGVGAAVSGLIGLPPTRFALVGLALGVAGVATVVVLVWRGYRPDALVLAAIAALVAEHVLRAVLRAAFGVEQGHDPGTSIPVSSSSGSPSRASSATAWRHHAGAAERSRLLQPSSSCRWCSRTCDSSPASPSFRVKCGLPSSPSFG